MPNQLQTKSCASNLLRNKQFIAQLKTKSCASNLLLSPEFQAEFPHSSAASFFVDATGK
jgi:hypothetical protein